VDKIRDLYPESGIAGVVIGCLLTVDVYGGDVRSAVKLQKQTLTQQLRSDGQIFPITAYHLVAVVVRIMHRQFLHSVGQANRYACALPVQKRSGEGAGEQIRLCLARSKTQR
jgi:hypothetical protein